MKTSVWDPWDSPWRWWWDDNVGEEDVAHGSNYEYGPVQEQGDQAAEKD